MANLCLLPESLPSFHTGDSNSCPPDLTKWLASRCYSECLGRLLYRVVYSLTIVPFAFTIASFEHCKEPILKIRNKYSQERNCTATVSISTFMCLWAIYTLVQEICGPIQIAHRHMNVELGLRPRNSQIKEYIHKWDFRCSEGPSHFTILKTEYLP